MYADDRGEKYVIPATMIRLMQELPPDCEVTTNRVGNLLVYRSGRKYAFVDIAWETVSLYDEADVSPPNVASKLGEEVELP